MNFEEINGFKKDLKVLLKKYKSLGEDLLVVRKVLMILPEERPPFSYRIEHPSDIAKIIKIQKIACRSLKGTGVNSGLCLIYAYFKKEKRIVMIGLYDTSGKSGEDRKIRILELKSGLSQKIRKIPVQTK